MNVIAFQGSPRKGGNTDSLLKSAIEGVQDAGHKARIFNLNSIKIRPCQNCGVCEKEGLCHIKDDMVDIALNIREADRIIIASPIYFFGLSAQTKIMIDRTQQFWCEKYLLKRPVEPGPFGRKGLLMVVGGMKREIGVKCSDATATAFFRSVNVLEHKVLSFVGVDAKGAIIDHPTALEDARRAGIELVAV